MSRAFFPPDRHRFGSPPNFIWWRCSSSSSIWRPLLFMPGRWQPASSAGSAGEKWPSLSASCSRRWFTWRGSAPSIGDRRGGSHTEEVGKKLFALSAQMEGGEKKSRLLADKRL